MPAKCPNDTDIPPQSWRFINQYFELRSMLQ